MPEETRTVAPGPREGTVCTMNGEVLSIPAGWVCLPPGDATLTRRVKASGPTWTVQERKGRKIFSLGVWADPARIEMIRSELEAERATESYAKRQAGARRRRDAKQAEYVEDFQQAVRKFLNFAPCYRDLADQLSAAIAAHATPVGSGTVARTERIPLPQRAEAAVIAWMRHNTTGYDFMRIARVRGERREVRRELAAASREILRTYQRGEPVDEAACPLRQALNGEQTAENCVDFDDYS